jgi:hypothetical protein
MDGLGALLVLVVVIGALVGLLVLFDRRRRRMGSDGDASAGVSTIEQHTRTVQTHHPHAGMQEGGGWPGGGAGPPAAP